MAFLGGDTFSYDNTAYPLKYSNTVLTSVTFGDADGGYFPDDVGLQIATANRIQDMGTAGEFFGIIPGNTEYYIHFLAKGIFTGVADEFFVMYNELNAIQWSLFRNANNTISFRRGTTVVATSAGTLTDTGWHHIAIKITVDSSSGDFEMKVDDVVFLSYTGDTSGQSNQTSGYFRLCGIFQYYDHITVNDTSGTDGFTGYRTYPFHAQVIRPNAAGNSTDWTPSTGSNYQNVDNESWDAATYNSSSTNNHRDDYNLEDVGTAITGTVEGVQVRGHFQKDDAASKQVSVGLYTNTTEYDGTAVEPPNGTYAGGEVREFWGNNPNTATAFTTGEITALQASVKIRANMATADVAQVYVEVFHSTSATSTSDVSQVFGEVFHTTNATSNSEVSQLYVEIFHEQPSFVSIIGATPLSRGRALPAGGVLAVTTDVDITGASPLARSRVLPSGGSFAPMLLGTTPLARSRVLPAGGIVSFNISVPFAQKFATAMVAGAPTIKTIFTDVATMKFATRLEYFPQGGIVSATGVVQHVLSRISASMPVAFIVPRRLTSTTDPSPDETAV